MTNNANVLFHKSFELDKKKLDRSMNAMVDKKINAIAKDTFRNKGHRLYANLNGFRSQDVAQQLYKIIFSYCNECRRVGRNPKYIGNCEFCAEMIDECIIFWCVKPHKGGKRDVYEIAAKNLEQLFPPIEQ